MVEESRPIVALDAMGSDLGVEATVAGAAKASLVEDGPEIVVVGDRGAIEGVLSQHAHEGRRIRIEHVSGFVSMQDDPRDALARPDPASISVAAQLVATGDAHALVSAGNTGAVTLTCARTFARLPGVTRCALGAVFPTELRRGEKNDPFSLILDAGLTLDVTAEDLVGFALMGSAYARSISRNDNPKVALLSNGTEPHKGTQPVVGANRVLSARTDLCFIGNIEGIDIPRGTADVIVTGGFTGNIVLKMLEGVAETVMRLGRYAMDKNVMYKAGLALLSPAVKQLRRVTDWEQYGGAPILGFDHLCIKAHGRSTSRAIANAIRVAERATRVRVVESIRTSLNNEGRSSSVKGCDGS